MSESAIHEKNMIVLFMQIISSNRRNKEVSHVKRVNMNGDAMHEKNMVILFKQIISPNRRNEEVSHVIRDGDSVDGTVKS